jgi:hypothetical protein
MLFTVISTSPHGNLALRAASVVLTNGTATLTLRGGRQIVGASGTIQRLFYQDQCFQSLGPDPDWTAAFKAKAP